MFAILQHIPGMSCNNLPESYRSSPFFTLDEFVSGFICAAQSSETRLSAENEHSSHMDFSCEREISRQKTSRSIAALSRERLSLIATNTYLCEDVEVLEQLAETPLDANTFLESHLPRLSGFVTGPDIQVVNRQVQITAPKSTEDETIQSVIIQEVKCGCQYKLCT